MSHNAGSMGRDNKNSSAQDGMLSGMPTKCPYVQLKAPRVLVKSIIEVEAMYTLITMGYVLDGVSVNQGKLKQGWTTTWLAQDMEFYWVQIAIDIRTQGRLLCMDNEKFPSTSSRHKLYTTLLMRLLTGIGLAMSLSAAFRALFYFDG